MKKLFITFLLLLSLTLTSNTFSQNIFDFKYSINDISAQRELFKSAKVKSAVIKDNSDFDEKITFDKEGKIIEKLSYQSGDEDSPDGKSIYEYDLSGNLILIRSESGDFSEPTILTYDENGNIINFKCEEYEMNYFYSDKNEMTHSEILNQVIEVLPIESVIYEAGLIQETKSDCWDKGVDAPYTYSKTKYIYDSENRVSDIIWLYGNCKTDTEKILFEQIIEYNEKNLPVRVVFNDNSGNKEIQTIRYNYFD